jgi:hypothetical protein
MEPSMYYYRIKFTDGRVVIRTHVTKKVASAMHEAMVTESGLFAVDEVSWGRCA